MQNISNSHKNQENIIKNHINIGNNTINKKYFQNDNFNPNMVNYKQKSQKYNNQITYQVQKHNILGINNQIFQKNKIGLNNDDINNNLLNNNLNNKNFGLKTGNKKISLVLINPILA